MTELDVFVGNFATIDFDLFSLWLSGLSVAEAVPVWLRDNRSAISDYFVSQDIIVSDIENNWRLFSMLETTFTNTCQTAPLQLCACDKRRAIESYHSLDPTFCREIFGRKLNSKLRKDLDEVADKTNILVRSCRRQFDNIKKISKAVEDGSPKNYIGIISRDFLLSKSLAEKYAALVFAAAFRLELGKKKLSFLTFDQVKIVCLTMVNDWGDKEEVQEPTLDKEFLSSLRDLKILLDREKEHRNAVVNRLKKDEIAQGSVLSDLENNFKQLTRSIVSLAGTLSSQKDVKDIFVHLVERPIETFRAVGLSKASVDVFLKAYEDVVMDNTLMLENEHKILVGRFVKTIRTMILSIYE